MAATLPGALQAQAAGHGGPDPITAGRRRPGKKRSGSEDAEDVPLVVDEHGNTVALEVDKDGVVAAGQHDDPRETAGDDGGEGKEKNKEVEEKKKKDGNAAMSIGGRKRKIGKIVGGGDEEEDGVKEAKGKGEEADKKDKAGAKKPKKKTKAIKLSFDED
ncbi:hypothetical protein NLG97_g8760 [Lecanicillium saksenae]|uniref:Uncharacterized protein n=1 Tax=Lecanicillium saksenae TaxID=468837 RepID=A0ACC1QJS6_9HYPO|nr:hypothetical protein NLG97_g8760 [Lecanicillium saksenae]